MSFFKNFSSTFGIIVLLLVLFSALFASIFSPFDPLLQELDWRLKPPGWIDRMGGVHLLGTDDLGRDILSRIIFGARVSLLVGFASVFVSGTVGVFLGLICGYFGGVIDRFLMRIVDIQLAFPFILLALSVIAVLGPNLVNLILVMAIRGWVVFARIVRGQVLTTRELDYVKATKAFGGGHGRILIRHILPNVLSPCIVLATLEMAQMIITESTLSFLGLGVQPPTPTWGGMLHDGREYLVTAWWYPTFPGCAIMLTVLGINLLGDSLRDYFDPRMKT